ncbi:MAG: hypothetical protein QOD84_2447 [Acidobacteriaceae bacterium]|jgi:glycosyltransferase involved in cell wall biosynthesis
MRIAYFSPFPPQHTGIATYSMHLVAELRRIMEVDCYDFGNKDAGTASQHFADFATGGRVSALVDHDAVVYHLGNNPWYHLEIFRTLKQLPGIVVLHDVILYYLMAGGGIRGLIKHFLLNYGFARAAEIKRIVADCPDGDVLRYRHPERYPMVGSIFPYASRIVVHNQHARENLVSLGYTGPIHVVPLLSYPNPAFNPEKISALRRQHRIGDGELVIGCLGFIGPSKRLDKVCEALSRIKNELPFRLLIVGEGEDPTDAIVENGLVDRTIVTRYVPNESFSDYMALTDVLVNLRFPSMGESSATLIQALALGKPCVVTNDASFRDLPDNCVVKIDVGESEVSDLADAITALGVDLDRRASLGAAALRFVESNWSGRRIAHQFQRVIEADIKTRAQEGLKTRARDLEGLGTAGNIVQSRLLSSVPPHLREMLRGLQETRDSALEGQLTKEKVRWAYKFFLNREPESDSVIDEAIARFRGNKDFRNALLSSEEYIRNERDDFWG